MYGILIQGYGNIMCCLDLSNGIGIVLALSPGHSHGFDVILKTCMGFGLGTRLGLYDILFALMRPCNHRALLGCTSSIIIK